MTAQRVMWWSMAAILAVFLAVGAVHGGTGPSAPGRAAAIDAQVRCPSCDGIPVSQSSASTAVAIRRAVAARIAAGQSDSQIEAFLVGKYGQSILLSPPVSGGTSLVWILPVAGVGTALAVLGVFFWRRRTLVSPLLSEEDRLLVQREMAGERSS